MTQTIEQLTARVRELEEENARLNGVIESNIDDGIDKIMAMSDEQISALAGFEGSNPQDKATIARQCMDIAMLRFDLAASQAYAEQLREAFVQLMRVVPREVYCENMHHVRADQHDYDETCPVVSRYSEAISTSDKALSLPTDTSALDAFVAEKVTEAWPIVSSYPDQNTELRRQLTELTRQRDLAVEALEKVGELMFCGKKDQLPGRCSTASKLVINALSTIKESDGK